VTRAEPDDWGTLYIQIKSQSGILRHMCPECFRPFRDKLHLHGDEESFSIWQRRNCKAPCTASHVTGAAWRSRHANVPLRVGPMCRCPYRTIHGRDRCADHAWYWSCGFWHLKVPRTMHLKVPRTMRFLTP